MSTRMCIAQRHSVVVRLLCFLVHYVSRCLRFVSENCALFCAAGFHPGYGSLEDVPFDVMDYTPELQPQNPSTSSTHPRCVWSDFECSQFCALSVRVAYYHCCFGVSWCVQVLLTGLVAWCCIRVVNRVTMYG